MLPKLQTTIDKILPDGSKKEERFHTWYGVKMSYYRNNYRSSRKNSQTRKGYRMDNQPHKHCPNCGYKLDCSSESKKPSKKTGSNLKPVIVFVLLMIGLAILAQVVGTGAL